MDRSTLGFLDLILEATWERDAEGRAWHGDCRLTTRNMGPMPLFSLSGSSLCTWAAVH